MTAPLDEKGLLPCPFCGAQANSHQVRARSVRFVCPDCEASGPIADGDPEQEQVWEDARIAWNRRAYLAASPSPSEKDVVAFDGVAKRKLDGLLERGWKVSGYAIHQDGDHGLITTGGFVGWFSVAERNDADARAKLEVAEARIKALEEALETVIAAYDDCSGAEPSLSVLHRTIDIDARSALKENAL